MTTDISVMSDAEYKVYENRLRRMAERRGLALHKSRRRDPRALSYGTYWLIDTYTNTVVCHQHTLSRPDEIVGVDLDAIDEYLTGEDERLTVEQE